MAIVQHVKCLGVGLALAASSAAFAQSDGPDESVGGPLSGPIPFVNAPFSADAITTVRHNLRNGTRLEQSTTARYYRDSGGRVRVELLMEGLRAPKTPSERHIRLAVYPMADVYPNVAEPRVFTLDEVTRTTRGAAGSALPLSSGGGAILGVPVGGVRFVIFRRAAEWARREPELVRGAEFLQESLGTRRIAGVETTGHRTTLIFPAWYVGNDAPFRLIDEEWQSEELRLLIYGHYTDSRSGDIEYRLTKIRRADPSPHLFVVPPDYTFESPWGSREDPVVGFIGPERYSAEETK